MIRFINVSKTYVRHAVLNAVDFHLPKGGMAFLTGPSGAGKSTLIKLVTRMETPSSGRIYFDGQALGELRKSQIPSLRQQMGIVFQDHKLLLDRSVFDNVALMLKIAGLGGRQSRHLVHEALARVGLSGREKMLPSHLSGGEQQRVGIARAIAHRPKLLVADEPTGNLDLQLSADIMRLFAQINNEGMSVLIATHDLQQIQQFRHPVFTLENGRLEEKEISA